MYTLLVCRSQKAKDDISHFLVARVPMLFKFCQSDALVLSLRFWSQGTGYPLGDAASGRGSVLFGLAAAMAASQHLRKQQRPLSTLGVISGSPVVCFFSLSQGFYGPKSLSA